MSTFEVTTRINRKWLERKSKSELAGIILANIDRINLFRDEDRTFSDWWTRDGKYYDPDFSDVDWYDKRHGLAEYAWNAAIKRATRLDAATTEDQG